MTSYHSITRVDPPEALAVPRRVSERLTALKDDVPTTREIPVDETAPVVTRVTEAGQDLAKGAEGAARAAQREPMPFADIVAARATAFLVYELHRCYLRWRNLNLGRWEMELRAWATANPGGAKPVPTFTPERRDEYAKQLQKWAEDMHEAAIGHTPPLTGVPRRLPADYAAGVRTGRPHELLKVLLGEDYRTAAREALGLRSSRLQLAALWPRLVACVWPPADAQAVPRLRELLGKDHTIVRSAVDGVLLRTSVELTPQRVTEVTNQILALVARYAPDGDLSKLTDEALLELMGKPMSVEEFIHRAAIGFSMMADETELIGSELFEHLLKVQGIESFLEMVLKKSGYEHGYTFEVFLVLRELASHAVPDPSKIWMQLVVGGKQGPDIGRILGEGADRRVQLIQAKSYRDIKAVMRPTDTGEIFKQMRSDLLRLAKDNFMVTGPDGTKLPIDRQLLFAVDWWHLRTTSFRMEGIDPKELHAMHVPPAAASLDFYDRYIHKKLVDLQEELNSPKFRKELGLPDDDPGFTIDVDIVDRILPAVD
jgi:hypothetical protein